METVSENKPKRGRPRSSVRIFTNQLEIMHAISPDIHSQRGKIDSAFRTLFFAAWMNAGSDIQVSILGCTGAEFETNAPPFPRGFNTAATEIGRWIADNGQTHEAKETALGIVARARDNDYAWRDIRAHFRKLRLGERTGSRSGLFNHLACAVDDYCRMFPATTYQVKMEAINDLLGAIIPPDE